MNNEITLNKLAIIGAGGIGSHFCRIFKHLILAKQFEIYPEVPCVYDYDIVTSSNLKHQDFTSEDINIPKAIVMNTRYEFKPVIQRFSTSNLSEHSFFIICADNMYVRTIIYEHVLNSNERKPKKGETRMPKGFLDMRTEGDLYAVYTQAENKETLFSSLGEDKSSKEGTSCQKFEDMANNRIQLGNMAVPIVGLQILLNMYRGEKYPASKIRGVI